MHPRYDAAHVFRLALADALTQAGPDARTLCTGWTTADLAAHLYVRENDPLSLPGIAGLPGPAGPAAQRLTTRSMERALTRHGYQGVVDLFRAHVVDVQPE
ncbi:MAG: maleylpyruvate isomerase N-terminal domain-containing protein, partial [Propionibacterium sp.]|nr:maleylpyruvate isomerase N-terminal domain-containing protein [Propionibacterium sp.]